MSAELYLARQSPMAYCDSVANILTNPSTTSVSEVLQRLATNNT